MEAPVPSAAGLTISERWSAPAALDRARRYAMLLESRRSFGTQEVKIDSLCCAALKHLVAIQQSNLGHGTPTCQLPSDRLLARRVNVPFANSRTTHHCLLGAKHRLYNGLGIRREQGYLMKRTGLLATALMSSVAGAAQAEAAEIVQYDFEAGIGFSYFDSTLGALNSVTLALDASRVRDWTLVVPGNPNSRTATYDLTAPLNLRGLGLGSGTTVDLRSGAGTQIVAVESAGQTPFFNGPASAGTLTIAMDGQALFTFNPTLFATASYNFFDRFEYDAFMLGFHDAGIESAGMYGSIGINGRNTLLLREGCGGGDWGFSDAYCGRTRYTLTYNYTPHAVGAAVPEPGTWAMMLLGFGAIGFSMRRSRRAPVPRDV